MVFRSRLARFLVRNERRLAGSLLLIGVVLRLVPILWGSVHFNADQSGFHPDEPKLVRYIDDFPESLSTYHDYRYPSLLPFGYGLLWAPVAEVLDLSSPEPSLPGQRSYEAALLFGRAANVLLFGLGGLLLVWGFTRYCFGRGPALLALAAANCLGRPLLSTALVLPDVPSAVLLFAAFFLLARAEREDRLTNRSMAGVGAVIGLATAVKYTPAVGLLGVVLVLGRAVLDRRIALRAAIRRALVTGASAVLTFLLFVPGVLYDTQRFVGSMTFELRNKLSGSELDPLLLPQGALRCYGAPLLLVAALGVVLALRARRSPSQRRGVTLLAATVCLVVYSLLFLDSFRADYAVLYFPFVAMFAGVGLWGILRLPVNWTLVPVVAALLLGTLDSARWGIVRYTGDPYYRIDAWIKSNVPPGPLGRAPSPTFHTVEPAPPRGYEYVPPARDPEFVVLSGRYRDGVMGFLDDPEGTYRLMVKRWGEERAARFFSIEPGKRRFGALDEAAIRFYEGLLREDPQTREYELVAGFEPVDSPLDMPGYWMGVYRRLGDSPRGVRQRAEGAPR